ncbi:hypothetical protein N1851_022808 [Merluccius polli]|uniref:Uncharacterized protein n=1 Tax=Merluccius polli TaxID=89951 RepID=A0AA47MHJ8_MERPO|nr:hypothetical protein N1851_022808 [Merluccius polli]
MSEDELAKATIERAHRLGRKKERKSRPVVVRFLNFRTKLDVLERGYKLKDSHYSMFEQFPREIVERRRLLVPIMKEHRAQKIKTRLVRPRLLPSDFRRKSPARVRTPRGSASGGC